MRTFSQLISICMSSAIGNRPLLIGNSIVILFASSMTMLGGCSSSKPPPPADADLMAYNSSARLEFNRGEITQAAETYTRALNRACVMDDPAAISTAAYNLAICRAALADYPAANTLLEEAEHESHRFGGNLANILLVEAKVALLQKDSARAIRLADAVLTRPGSRPSDEQRLQARVTQGLAACQAKNVTEAAQHLAEARTLADRLHGISARAAVSGLAGEVHLLNKDFPAAAVDFDQQAEWCRQSHNYRDMRRALAEAGRADRAAGDLSKAADRLYRAARAAVARGDTEAMAWAGEALAAAHVAHDSSLIQLTTSLLHEARAATQPAGQ